MKKISFLVLGVIFVLSVNIHADLNDGLVANYPFNGNADDESGNGYHGTINGATLSEDRFGNIDSAYYFDGVDDYLNMGYALPHTERMTNFSISVWTKVISETWNHGIVAKPAGNGSQGYHYGFGVMLYRNEFWVWSNKDGWWPWASTTEGVTQDVWTHVAVTCRYISWREREFHIYVNGQASILNGNVGLTILADPQLYVGAGGTGGLGSHFNGYIDDIHIYNRPLTVDEVSLLLNPAPVFNTPGFGPPLSKGLVAVKKNRVLPVKIQLYDSDGASISDLDITTAPSIEVLYESPLLPDFVDVTDQALYAGLGTNDFQLVFTGENNWQYNLKTENYTAPGTYVIHIKSGDKSEYTIDQSYAPAQFFIAE